MTPDRGPSAPTRQGSSLPAEPLESDVLHRLRDLALSESGFVFDPFSGATFSVNDTGKAVLEALRSGTAPAAVPALLAERFAPPGEGTDVDRDVADFLAQLRRMELLPAPEAS